MKVRPTCTDSAGNGYYRGTDGKYYYGNVKNGYLKETLEERNKRLAKMRSEQKAENLRVKQKRIPRQQEQPSRQEQAPPEGA